MDAVKRGRLAAKDEMNLAEFALCGVRSRELDEEGKFIVYRGTVWDPGRKEQVARELVVEGSQRYGLPFGTDDDILLACVKLSRATHFKTRRLIFSAYEVLKELGWSDGGERFERLRDGLRRWSKIRIHSERHFWDHERQCFYDEDFGIIDTLRVPRAKAERWQLVWSDGFWRSLRSGYVKSLDWELYLSLSSHVAKRLYRLLDKRFYRDQQSEFRFDLRELGVRHVGLSDSKSNAHMKRELQAGIRELESKWFRLEAAEPDERFRRIGRGAWEVVFVKATRVRREVEKAVVQQPTSAGDEMTTKLLACGVAEKVASELVANFAMTKVAEKIELFEWLLEKQDKRIAKNPAGFLVAAIRDDYPLPKGFKTKAMREAERTLLDERKRRRQAAEDAENAKREAEHAAQEQALNDYLAGLSDAERNDFETKAIDADSGFLRQLWRRQGSDDGLYFRMMLRNYLASLEVVK